jgi:hypothetical protein
MTDTAAPNAEAHQNRDRDGAGTYQNRNREGAGTHQNRNREGAGTHRNRDHGGAGFSAPTARHDELSAINRALADLLGAEPASLAHGADAALSDELIFCGMLGGKNVGKSTLINALARETVSTDASPTGRGTERPMVYVHEQAEQTALTRLRTIDAQQRLDVTRHRADAIRHLVLVDLPDFDSEFTEHVAIVRRIAPLMDRVIWVATPRKLGDRAWVEMLNDVIKDARNVHGVLNKMDELLADGDPFEDRARRDDNTKKRIELGDAERADHFRRRYDEWLADISRQAGSAYEENHRFLVAAAFTEEDRFVSHIAQRWDDPEWSRYGSDREAVRAVARRTIADLDRLRESVLSPLSEDEAQAIKSANLQRELDVSTARLRDHYDLDRTAQQLVEVCEPDYQVRLLDDAFDDQIRGALISAVEANLRRDTELADELLERRVNDWPLLRLVHWPFGWLSRALGRRVGTLTDARGFASRHDPFRGAAGSSAVADEATLRERCEQVRTRLLTDFAVLTGPMRIEPELTRAEVLAERLRTRLANLPAQYETDLIERIRLADRRPAYIKRCALWLILLWFPFGQPILTGLLEMFSDPAGWRLAHGAYRIVSALSAVHLLAGFAVVAGVYIAILAAMYARALRAVRHARDDDAESGSLAAAVEQTLHEQLIEPLLRSFHRRRERLEFLLNGLNRLKVRDSFRTGKSGNVPVD